MRYSKVCVVSFVAVLAAALLPGRASAQTQFLANGPNPGANGYLEVRPDAYGSWSADFTAGASGNTMEIFRPHGLSAQAVSFTNALFFFNRTGTNNAKQVF